MNCERLEKLIALYVEGDLGQRKARRVEAHLNECGACRGLAEELRESQAALKSLQGEAADGLILQTVRSRVLDQLAAGQRSPSRVFAWAWGYALAGALIVLVGGAILWRSQTLREAPKPEVLATVAKSPTVEETPPMPAPAKPAKRRRAYHPPKFPDRPKQPPAASEPLMVKLVTDDPNVVIIWLVDRNGG